MNIGSTDEDATREFFESETVICKLNPRLDAVRCAAVKSGLYVSLIPVGCRLLVIRYYGYFFPRLPGLVANFRRRKIRSELLFCQFYEHASVSNRNLEFNVVQPTKLVLIADPASHHESASVFEDKFE
jgi:hypothetical protein